MESVITIDGSGRLVIPKDIRRRLRLTGGTRLVVIQEGDQIRIIPQREHTSVAEKDGLLVFRGRLDADSVDHRTLTDERLDHLAGL